MASIVITPFKVSCPHPGTLTFDEVTWQLIECLQERMAKMPGAIDGEFGGFPMFLIAHDGFLFTAAKGERSIHPNKLQEYGVSEEDLETLAKISKALPPPPPKQ